MAVSSEAPVDTSMTVAHHVLNTPASVTTDSTVMRNSEDMLNVQGRIRILGPGCGEQIATTDLDETLLWVPVDAFSPGWLPLQTARELTGPAVSEVDERIKRKEMAPVP